MSPRQRRTRIGFGAVPLALALMIGACGSDTDSADNSDTSTSDTSTSDTGTSASPGIVVVSPDAANATIEAGDPDLVVLDVRTQDEYDESHLANAVLIDFYSEDFAAKLGELDPTVPYVLYCRSGNRSGQTRAIMEDLNFEEVYDIDGGITAWTSAGFGTE